MKRREFIRTSAQAAASTLLLDEILLEGVDARSRPPVRKPNIVVIVADDLGYHDLGVQGNVDIPTPNIDSIARAGIRYTNGYVTCPVCSPTRAGLTTGRYQQRFGHEFNPGPAQAADPNFGLPLSQTTLANRLKALGYATGMVGKWHLGFMPEYHPMKRGFDEFFGFLGGQHAYTFAGMGVNALLRGTEPAPYPGYLTDAFAREAVGFIERNSGAPFFLYMPFNAVHLPLQALQKYRDRLPDIQAPRRRTYGAMLTAMDDAVGQILEKLRELKLEEDTLVFFVSDNGGPTAATTSRNDPLRGHKGQVWEGGIRTPAMIQWKGHLPAGKVYDHPVLSLDIHPTAVAAAGGVIPPDAKLDGVNLLPFLTGKNKHAPHESLFWRFGPQWAARVGDWKLVQGPEVTTPEMYNLAADIGEATNLAEKEPGRVKAMQAAYDAWNAQNIEPLWGGRAGGGAGRLGRRLRRRLGAV